MPVSFGDLDALIGEIDKRSHQRAVEIAEESRRRAAAILEGSNEECESIRRQSADAAERQLAALVRRNAARAELEAQRRVILLREAPMVRVWHAAEERLRDLVRQPVYQDVLKNCALRAARELGAPELILAADPIGHELLTPESSRNGLRNQAFSFTVR